ncbi:MAG: low molecular weight protein arginine phosphatase [Peptococcaceae bacterium]|nr:low molecular weight protein arginine phosphatase [Peptococcaceae bacterium]
MRLLFVCTGNTCRSPMAQGLAKLYFSNKVEVVSAGINAFETEPVSSNAQKVLWEKGIDISEHRAVRCSKELIEGADFIFTMTKAQESYLSCTYPQYKDKIRCLGYLSGDKEVPDPWGGSIETYRRCAIEMEKMLGKIAQELQGTE